MKLTNEQTQRLKEIELEMFKVFETICKEENLSYVLVGGSALGAIRHKGFIPWDDDIDVGMPRSDYEKFIRIAQSKMPDYLFLQNSDTENEYTNTFSKIRNSNTTFIETSCKNLKINHGVYLDIFPLDGYPSSKVKRFILEKFKLVYQFRISLEYNISFKMKLKTCFFAKILKIIYPDYRAVVKKLDKLFKKYDYDKCETIANHGGAWGNREIMPKEYIGKGTVGEFEGLSVMLPEQTDKYLTCLYGDYMVLPPVEKRVGHHYTTVIDFDNPYTKYM